MEGGKEVRRNAIIRRRKGRRYGWNVGRRERGRNEGIENKREGGMEERIDEYDDWEKEGKEIEVGCRKDRRKKERRKGV